MAKQQQIDEPQTIDPFAWDSDPVVLVSKRPRQFHVPRVIFEREPTAAERAAWKGRESSSTVRADQWVAILPGIQFLGTLSTSWNDIKALQPGQVSQVPDMSKAVLVNPASQMQATIRMSSAVREPSTGRIKPAEIRKIFERVLEHVREECQGLWVAGDAFDSPELMMLPLSEVFRQATTAGQQACSMVLAAIPKLRRSINETVTPLGVLHDYAIRSRAGGAAAIVAACKSKAAAWSLGTG